MTHSRVLARALSACSLALTSAGASLLQPSISLAQAPRGHAAPEAEAFVQSEANKVIDTLGERSLPETQRRQTFRRLIDQVADIPKVTDFVLGKYRRTISPAQYGRFAQAFRAYAYWVYESRLGSYTGQKLQVTGSVERRPGDVVVYSRVVGPTNGRSPDVQWRVIRDGGGQWRAVDVNVRGIWLAITEQQDFASTLDNNGGNVDALVAELQRSVRGGR